MPCLPDAVRRRAEALRAAVETDLSDLRDRDRGLCVLVALATWMHQLDRRGELDVPARHVAYLYQVGRMAAQEVSPTLHHKLYPILAAIEGDARAGYDLRTVPTILVPLARCHSPRSSTRRLKRPRSASRCFEDAFSPLICEV